VTGAGEVTDSRMRADQAGSAGHACQGPILRRVGGGIVR